MFLDFLVFGSYMSLPLINQIFLYKILFLIQSWSDTKKTCISINILRTHYVNFLFIFKEYIPYLPNIYSNIIYIINKILINK